MARGVDKAKTFLDERDHFTFLSLLREPVLENYILVHAYCLMPTHFHLLLEVKKLGLHLCLQQLLGQYAQRFNRRYDRCGHLWQDRHKRLLVEHGDYFLRCSRYIHLNPVRAHLSSKPELYPWSSYSYYLGEWNPFPWLHTEKTLSCFKELGEYREFVEADVENCSDPFEEATAGLVFGGEEFLEKIKRRVETLPHDNATLLLQSLKRSSDQKVAVAQVRSVVEFAFSHLTECQRGRMVMYFLRTATSLRVNEIARMLGCVPSTVTEAVKAIRQRLKSDDKLARDVVRIGRHLECSIGPDAGEQQPESSEAGIAQADSVPETVAQ